MEKLVHVTKHWKNEATVVSVSPSLHRLSIRPFSLLSLCLQVSLFSLNTSPDIGTAPNSRVQMETGEKKNVCIRDIYVLNISIYFFKLCDLKKKKIVVCLRV